MHMVLGFWHLVLAGRQGRQAWLLALNLFKICEI